MDMNSSLKKAKEFLNVAMGREGNVSDRSGVLHFAGSCGLVNEVFLLPEL